MLHKLKNSSQSFSYFPTFNQNRKSIMIEIQENEESGKVRRKIYFENYAVPCGGTHVAELSEIGKVKIRKVKNKKDHVKISYEI